MNSDRVTTKSLALELVDHRWHRSALWGLSFMVSSLGFSSNFFLDITNLAKVILVKSYFHAVEIRGPRFSWAWRLFSLDQNPWISSHVSNLHVIYMRQIAEISVTTCHNEMSFVGVHLSLTLSWDLQSHPFLAPVIPTPGIRTVAALWKLSSLTQTLQDVGKKRTGGWWYWLGNDQIGISLAPLMAD